jgi:hypothetical protein
MLVEITPERLVQAPEERNRRTWLRSSGALKARKTGVSTNIWLLRSRFQLCVDTAGAMRPRDFFLNPANISPRRGGLPG